MSRLQIHFGEGWDNMSPFETFVEGLKEYPKIETFCVKDKGDEPLLVNDKAIMAETIKAVGETKEAAEKLLMDKISEFIRDKQVWIRKMPEVKENFELDNWNGYARIAVL